MIDGPADCERPSFLTRSQLAGLVAGNVLEFYDFTVFAFFAPQIGKSMFASGGASDGLLLALATFAVGFLARPIGAAVIGRYADTVGRKPAMVLSFALMGGALLVVGLTPPSSMLGIGSAVIIALARLVQGFALGGETGPTTALLIETAPPHRRGTYGGWQIACQGLAVLLAGFVGLAISSLLSPQDVVSWGWRIALLAGTIVLPIGFYLRSKVPETLARHGSARSDLEVPPLPLRRLITFGLLLILSGTVTNYTLQYFSTYCISILKLNAAVAFTVTATTGLSLFVFGLAGGWLSDRFGRRQVIVWPRIALLAAIYPTFAHIIVSPTLAALTTGVFILTALFGLSTAAANVCLAEGFPPAKRSTGYAVTYAIAGSVFGGSAQFFITWMIKASGSHMVPAWWLIAATLVGILSGLAMPVPRDVQRPAMPGASRPALT